MVRKTRRIVGIVCIMLAISLFPATTFAVAGNDAVAGEGMITPYWAGVTMIHSDLICSNGQANVVIDVIIDRDKVDRVNFKGDLLQYKNSRWTVIESWNITKPVSLGHSYIDQYYNISKGYNYMFVTTIKAYKGSALVDTINFESYVRRY